MDLATGGGWLLMTGLIALDEMALETKEVWMLERTDG